MAKSKEKLEAIELRRSGKSIKFIAKKLSVSPGSVSIWCRDVVLTQNQLRILERNAHDPNYGRRLQNSQKQRNQKELKIKNLLDLGEKEIGELSKRELFLVGVALYWAEGFKKDTQVGFANSNPEMINLYLKWLYECCNVKKDDLIVRITVNISHKDRSKEIQEYWSNSTKISEENFRKPFYQQFKWKKIYEKPNEYYGVLRIKVRRSTDFLRKIHGWIKGLGNQGKIW